MLFVLHTHRNVFAQADKVTFRLQLDPRQAEVTTTVYVLVLPVQTSAVSTILFMAEMRDVHLCRRWICSIRLSDTGSGMEPHQDGLSLHFIIRRPCLIVQTEDFDLDIALLIVRETL